MNGFIRATHENGVYRNLPEWDYISYENEGYVHFLGDKPMTLYEICKAVETYNNQNYDSGFSIYPPDICKSLIDMIQYDMVRVVPMSDYFNGI